MLLADADIVHGPDHRVVLLLALLVQDLLDGNALPVVVPGVEHCEGQAGRQVGEWPGAQWLFGNIPCKVLKSGTEDKAIPECTRVLVDSVVFERTALILAHLSKLIII